MDILLTDSLLRDFLDTPATPAKIAECLSLCGPSIEKITKVGSETVYHIEVTTNRVDAASAKGIAQEALAILPQFGISTKLVKNNFSFKKSQNTFPVDITIDPQLCERFTAVLLSVEVKDSPKFIQSRLLGMEQRPINNIIDITNYAMFALGIPMHAFDAEKLGAKIVVREAKKGERFVTLDNATHESIGGEIVFDNGTGEIIDLPGIMGTKNSMVTNETKKVLLVLEHMNHHKVRFASLKHERRTHAAILNEKNPDPNQIDESLAFAVSLLSQHANAVVESQIFNWYPKPRQKHSVVVTKENIDNLLGEVLPQKEITRILLSLQFEVSWKKETATVIVPTTRAEDVTIPQDIIEEVARIYGYFRLPSNLPEGKLPQGTRNPQFDFEMKLKTLLSGWGGLEVYTLSFVSKTLAGEYALKVKNPLGGDGEYMRTAITPSLLQAAKVNRQETAPFHLFEIANVYLSEGKHPKKPQLPKEETRIAGIFANIDYRHAKGILEALFTVLHITKSEPVLKKGGEYYTYEFSLFELMSAYKAHVEYKPISLFPPQIEDMTLQLGDAKVGTVMKFIQNANSRISAIEFLGSYEHNFSFRISYQDPAKTLTDAEVSMVRTEILKKLQSELGVTEK